MILKVIKALYIDGYYLELSFNNGIVRVVDLKDELGVGIFEPLLDIEYFKAFYIANNTVEWENGADFAPEYLFLISLPCADGVSVEEIERLRRVARLYGMDG